MKIYIKNHVLFLYKCIKAIYLYFHKYLYNKMKFVLQVIYILIVYYINLNNKMEYNYIRIIFINYNNFYLK